MLSEFPSSSGRGEHRRAQPAFRARFPQQPPWSTREGNPRGPPLLTFQDISSLQFLHRGSLAQSSAEKHQNYILHHGGCQRIASRVCEGPRWLAHPLKIASQKTGAGEVEGWGALRRRQPLAGKSSPTPAQEGRGPLSPGGWGSPRSRSHSGQAAHHVQICCQPGRLDGSPGAVPRSSREMVPCLGSQGGAGSRVSSFCVPSSQRPGHWHSPRSCSSRGRPHPTLPAGRRWGSSCLSRARSPGA